MDDLTFDRLTRALTQTRSRRTLLHRVVAGIALGVMAPRDGAAAKKRKKKKLVFNQFGCVNVGGKCRGKDANCCSGICQGKKPKQGKKDKSRCVGHDTGGCQAGQFEAECVALTLDVPCTTSGIEGRCDTTTGGAGYCRNFKRCASCQKDQDCVLSCGANAACIVCPNCEDTGGTACAGLEPCLFP
jgi:hypothetical protein